MNHNTIELIKTPTDRAEIIQIVASTNENVGGTATFVSSLADRLSQEELSSSVFTLDYAKNGRQITSNSFKVYSYQAHFLARHLRGFHPQAYRCLCQLARTQFKLIHSHGLWMFPNLYARQAALNYSLPLIVSPHGMLEPWSLSHSGFKKRLAWLLYERKNLISATTFHATSHSELNSIRSLGFKQPIALIPIGVDIYSNDVKVSREKIIEMFPEVANKRWLLFLSRLHSKKGIDNLLYVWQTLASQFSDWHLIIAGPDSVGYQKELELLVVNLNLQQRVTFTGMLTGELKESAMGNADLFILPSHSENFGIAIAESLSYGVPVITTKETPWQDLVTNDCGWWIDDERSALEASLIEAMQLPCDRRQEMGEKGKTLVKEKYSWDYIGKQMTEVYQWILSGGTTPSCVYLD